MLSRFDTVMTAAAVVLALAAFSCDDGTGPVDARDVQAAFGWQEDELQERAAGISFRYEAVEQYSAVCSSSRVEGPTEAEVQDVSHERVSVVRSAVRRDGDDRVSGFALVGYGAEVTPREAPPVVGGPCLGAGGQPGRWTEVVLVTTDGRLTAQHGSASVLLS